MANKNNKYKVYRKYTTEDNGITWVETDEYRIVLVEENSKDCITETPTNTRWVETTGYICANKNKYAKEIKQISTDGGKTWTDTSEYRQGKLIEENSKDCGYTEVQYRWVVINDDSRYVCVGTEKHKMEIRQLSNDGGITWANVTPEETRASDEIIELHSLDCGASPIQYKWVDTGFECGSNLSSDATIVNEAPGELTKETVYRWVVANGSDDYICDDGIKYYMAIRQSSSDGGITFNEVQPRETQKGPVMEINSKDCPSDKEYNYVWKDGKLYVDTEPPILVYDPENTISNDENGTCETIVNYVDGSSKSYKIYGALKESSIENKNSIKSISLGHCVTNIRNNAFKDCENLTGVCIPNSIILIGSNIFENCPSLTELTYQGTMAEWNSISKFEWDSKSSINVVHCNDDDIITGKNICETNVTYVDGSSHILNIGGELRRQDIDNIQNLKTIDLGYCITSIDDSCFENLDNLKNVIISDGMSTLGDKIFAKCSNLPKITYLGTKEQWNAITKGQNWNTDSLVITISCSDGDITIEQAYDKCETRAIYSTSDVKYYTINGELSQNSVPFKHISCALQSCNIGTCVTSIGAKAFYGYSYSVAPMQYDGLSAVTIPSSVASIGNEAFKNCYALKSINFPDSLKSIGSSAFTSCSGLTSVVIGEGVESIGEYSFYGCSGMTNLMLKNGIKEIGRNAFTFCNKLPAITIPESVETVGVGAFYSCSGLTAVTIGNGVKEISNFTFEYCYSLSEVNLPSSLIGIGSNAFFGCGKLNTIIFKGTTSQWNSITKGAGWNNNVPAKVVHCTDGDVKI